MIALVIGRFHAVTAAQASWFGSLSAIKEIERIVCVLTSADHEGTRRNPLGVALREELVTPVLQATGKPFAIVRIRDIPESSIWVEHVVAGVGEQTGDVLSPSTTRVFTANREVDALFTKAGFAVVSQEVTGLTPHELVQRIADGQPWKSEAAPSTVAVYERYDVVAKLRAIHRQHLLTDDGELGQARDFTSYGTQMDASLKQKLEDLVPWILPGKIVDKGCGTGKLLVELTRLFPSSIFVGIDLSREFLRMCDENHYASEEVALVFGNITEQQVDSGTASTILFSSVVHEIYSYSGYDRGQVHRALDNAARELKPGGRVLIRDGVSPGLRPWRIRFLDRQTRAQFDRFAIEFKHGQGAAYARVNDEEVCLSAHLANEFLCKKDYLKNWHIEVHEEYGTFTTDGWRAALDRTGFDPIEVRSYVNPWIAENWYRGTIALFDEEGKPIAWPDTNVVVVGQKRG